MEGPDPAESVGDRREGTEHQEFEEAWTSSSFGIGFGFGRIILATPRKGSLNRPERKILPRFNAGILKVNQIKVTVVTRTHEWFALCEDKGLVGTAIFRDSYSDNHAVLTAQPVDCQNFCGNGGHWSWRSTSNVQRLAVAWRKAFSF